MFRKKLLMIVKGGSYDRPYTIDQMRQLEEKLESVKGYNKIFIRGDAEIVVVK